MPSAQQLSAQTASSARSRNMSAIRSTENRTEVALRSALHRSGLRFRKYARDLPGNPDIVFRRARVAVFVDGDFWHARVLREDGLQALRARVAGPNKSYWLQKFQRRVARDDEVNTSLRASGWRVLRFWESELKSTPEKALISIQKAVSAKVERR